MLLAIPEVLTPAEVAAARAALDAAEWIDGRVTAGEQSAAVKQNAQLAEGSPVAQAVGEMILGGLARSPLFISAALPQRIFPPLFNRYGEGASFGVHVDNAIRAIPGTPIRLRTDLSCTLFFSGPEEYDGGELMIDDVYGPQRVKLPAGHLILYPSTSLHRVTPITRGARVASFFWLQSMIRADDQRALLFDLDQTIQRLALEKDGNDPSVVSLSGIYHNLLRQWAEV
jgi:PKHD-type hydroxylase